MYSKEEVRFRLNKIYLEEKLLLKSKDMILWDQQSKIEVKSRRDIAIKLG